MAEIKVLKLVGKGFSETARDYIQTNPDFKEFILEEITGDWDGTIAFNRFLELRTKYEELEYDSLGCLAKLWYRFYRWGLKTGKDDYSNS